MNKSIHLLGILLGSSSLLFLSACKKETTDINTDVACKITVLLKGTGNNELGILEYDDQHRLIRVKQPYYTVRFSGSDDTTLYHTTYTYETNRILVKQFTFSKKTFQRNELSSLRDTLLLDTLGRVNKNKDYKFSYTNEGYLSRIDRLNEDRQSLFTYESGNLIKQTEMEHGEINFEKNFTYYTDKEDKYLINGLGKVYCSDAHILTAMGSFYGKASKNLIKTQQFTGSLIIDTADYQFDNAKRPIGLVIGQTGDMQRAYTFGYDSSCY